MNSHANKKYFVYRYLDKDNNVIYVGLTARPLKKRVREHKVEELNLETVKIQYIILPNEAQMRQRELYYIDAYKPKYNKRDVHSGKPEIMPEYDAKWIDYPNGNDIKQVEWIIDTIFTEFFPDKKFPYFISISQKRGLIGICGKRLVAENGVIKYEVIICENDLISNYKRMLIDILAQIIQIMIKPLGIRASNRGVYFNKNVAKYFHKYGIKTIKGKYGFEPVDCDEKYIKELSQYEYGNGNITLYLPSNNLAKNGRKPSSTRKYICPCCGNSFRATKNINVLCIDCNEQFILE